MTSKHFVYRARVLGLLAISMLSCASAPKGDKDSEAGVLGAPAGAPADAPQVRKEAPNRKPVTGLTMTYQNQASQLSVALDPYDENLHIVMTRSAKTAIAPEVNAASPNTPREQPVRSTRNDTLVVLQPLVPAPAAPAANPLAPLDLDTAKRSTGDSLAPQVENWNEVTDEILGDMRRAQEAFYAKDYTKAMDLVRSAQSKRITAEGHALQGSIHYMRGERDAARREWMEALNLNPDMPDVGAALRKLDGAN